jgi:hypothetical protein
METADRRVPTGNDSDPLAIDRRSRRAFTISLVVVLAVVVVALGYSFVRDPGPQPTVPPKISGTDDGALKRAIVHYVGALESRNVEAMTDVMGTDTPAAKVGAQAVIDSYGDAAQRPATASVKDDPDMGGVKQVTITFEDGRTQRVAFVTGGPSDKWHPALMTELSSTGPNPTPSASASS